MNKTHTLPRLPPRHPLAQAVALALVLGSGGNAAAAPFTVTNNNDSGTGSLRQAVQSANTIAGADTITFDEGLGAIVLSTGQIEITETLSISGPASGQTVDGNAVSRIFYVHSGAPVTLENLTLTGGAAANGGAVHARSALTLNHCTVSGNSSPGGFGGGGIQARSGMTLTNSIVSGNTSSGTFGGGGIQANGETTLTNSIVSGNRATSSDSYGGGIYVADGDLTLTRSTVSGNSSASRGGGLGVYEGSVTLTNSTVSGNTAEYYGGGMYLYWGNVSLSNSTVTDNQTQNGAGGIDVYGGRTNTITLDSSILAANSGPNGNFHLYRNKTLNARHSLFGDPAGEINGSNSNNVFSNDPGLVTLADNGCAVPAGAPGASACVETHALLASSLALDSGDNPLTLSTDQRGTGFPRTRGAASDSGAFESGFTISFTVTNNNDSGTGSLRQAVQSANTIAGADTITFDEGLGAIVLSTGQIEITETLSISGPASGQTVDGNAVSRIFYVHSGAPVTLENLTLTGGAAANGGAVHARSALTLNHCTVSGNSSPGGFGGGGIQARSGMTLTNSIVSGNTSSGTFGGGGIQANGETTLTNSIVSGNRATSSDSYGGGIYVADGDLTLTRSTVSGNSSASRGGGLGVYEGSVTLTNSTVSGNTAEYYGGGMYLYWGNVSLSNSTVTDNQTQNGAGGIDVYGGRTNTITLDSSILAANSGPNGNFHLYRNKTLNARHSLFGDPAGEINGSNSNNVFSNDPGLVTLADNGCAVPAGAPGASACVETHALLASSLALDSGDNPLTLSTDQRGTGFPRTRGAASDSGAFEAVLQLTPVLSANQWHLLSPLALDNNGNTSVGQVVGDDILIANLDSTLYADGDNGGWIMYRNDDANDIYQVLNLNSVLAVGRGYWLKTLSSGQQFGVTGAANALTPILLEAALNPADGRFNMLGHPFDYSVCWRDVQISNDGFSTTLTLDDVDPGNVCNTAPGNSSCIMSRKMYQWNGSAFQTFDGVTPGAEGTLDVFDGFFVKAYKAGYELRVPATPGCSGSSMTLRRQRAHALVSSPVRPVRVAEAGEWSIRLIVSAGPLIDPGNLLGRLSTSKDGFDAHDLDELPADFDPYLTLVFPRPDWGEQAGDYTSDFRALASSRRGVTDWDFEIRSDQPREITLSWEIPTQDLRNKSRLIDLENKLTRRPKLIEQYTVRMTGTSHRFTWRLRNGR